MYLEKTTDIGFKLNVLYKTYALFQSEKKKKKKKRIQIKNKKFTLKVESLPAARA